MSETVELRQAGLLVFLCASRRKTKIAAAEPVNFFAGKSERSREEGGVSALFPHKFHTLC